MNYSHININYKKIKPVFVVLILCFLVCCTENKEELIVLGFEKDMIPEGIAVDKSTNNVFLNSLRHNKIVKCKLDGSDPQNFIESNQYGYLGGFGMTIKGDTLYALGNSFTVKNNRSILILLNKKSGELIDSYHLNDTSFIYLNDIAISSNNDIYITDSESNKIYTINRSKGELEIFLEDDQITYSNGISISDDDRYLYLASYYNGIRVVDLNTKKILNKANQDYGRIDGMKYYNNSLIGIANGRDENGERLKSKSGVYRYYLNKERNSIIKKEKIIPYEDYFESPTTFEIVDDYIYFIVNSQLPNLSDDGTQIINPEKLQSYLLMKKKI